jgi:hypothetical protein
MSRNAKKGRKRCKVRTTIDDVEIGRIVGYRFGWALIPYTLCLHTTMQDVRCC